MHSGVRSASVANFVKQWVHVQRQGGDHKDNELRGHDGMAQEGKRMSSRDILGRYQSDELTG